MFAIDSLMNEERIKNYLVQTNIGKMSTGAQIAMSAVIGGTADPEICREGGGKPVRPGRGGFANGAVTGAYVMMFNHLHGDRVEKKLQRKFQRNAMSDSDLVNFSPHEYVNGETVQTASGNEYILWDNKWLDLPEWKTIETTYGPIWDGGEGSVGITTTISRESYIKQEYLSSYLKAFRWGVSPSSLINTNPVSFLKSVFTGGIDNMIHAETLLLNRMKTHNSSTFHYRNKDKP
jgi:hypothetical protein